MAKIGIVVPTLGDRPDYLRECLESIRNNGHCVINLVAPLQIDFDSLLTEGLIDRFTADPGLGLARAISTGIQAFDSSVTHVSWLGDDDTLTPGSLRATFEALQEGDVAIFGDCNFIDENSKIFWTLETGPWAVPMLSWGPNKVPQPGSLLLREAVAKVGYLDESLGWAFDQDLFLKLKKIGHVRYLNRTLANFRWHDDSLSAGSSDKSVREAASVRIRHSRRQLRWLSVLREAVHVRLALAVRPSLDRRKSK
jgi:GT2 family glycosyltransferase